MKKAIAFAVFLAACDSPSPRFANAPAQSVNVNGYVFSIRILGDSVEAVRTSRRAVPSRDAVFSAARVAIERAANCAVEELSGDQAIVQASIACP
jgi:hypothetical protein